MLSSLAALVLFAAPVKLAASGFTMPLNDGAFASVGGTW
jgi:hypothetical protein